MNKICVYGAGRYTTKYLGVLKKEYDVAYILDRNTDKTGKLIEGVEVYTPSNENINQFPIIIMVRDIDSAYNTLISLGCNQIIYDIYVGGNRLVVFQHISNPSINDLINGKSISMYNQEKYSENYEIYENESTVFDPQKKRTFDIVASYEVKTTGGGPAASWRHLRELNEKYSEIDNFYSLCRGGAYIPINAPVDYGSKTFITGMDEKTYEAIIKYGHYSIADAFRLYLDLLDLWEFLDVMDARFHFSDEDVFLLQDIFIKQAFVYRFPNLIKNIISASHAQGTMGSEIAVIQPGMRKIYEEIELDQLKKIKEWIFPSKGAKNGFYQEATTEMKEIMELCNIHIAYNGYNRKKEIRPDKEFADKIEKITEQRDLLFVSTTLLYRHKGVERIPRVLSMVKEKTNLKLKWILIGSGEMEKQVENSIKEYLNEEDYIWYKKRFENQDNVFALFEKADFYIMMHDISVWDLATLQAMAYGCVPFLSAVGGNLEFCADDNGVLVDINNYKIEMEKYFRLGVFDFDYLAKQKEKNKQIILHKYNEENWIKGYANIIKEVLKKRKI